jgi:hypothetical protein
VEATLVVRDGAGGDPELFVEPSGAASSEAPSPEEEEEQEAPEAAAGAACGAAGGGRGEGGRAGRGLRVAVRRVDRVSLEQPSGDIVLTARKVDASGGQPARQLLRFALPPDSSSSGTESRNLAVHHLAVLVEWERQRRIAAGLGDDGGDGEDGDDEDADRPNFLAARAQKAAHFARRELEMRETRREREKRKARLVQEAGGLRYTALAMAGRGESA